MLISEFLSSATRTLQAVGIDSPRLEAELLLSTALGVGRQKLFLVLNTQLTNAECARANELLEIRASRFPLQYIMGTIEFLGLAFSVIPGVFIPRPETEILVTEAVALLPRFASPVIVDVGTGSGVIAVTLAVSKPEAQVHATDISSLAIEVARNNAARHGVLDRVSFHIGDLLSAVTPELFPAGVDIVVSNPPYIPTTQIPSLAPEVSKYEPPEALDGGPDGLCCIRAILRESAALLKTGGWLLLEIGAGQAKAAREIAASAGLTGVQTVKDLAGIERVLVTRKA